MSTTVDSRVHAYDTRRERIEVIYDGLAEAPLLRVDQLTGLRAGELFVCEDLATDEIDMGLIDRSGRVSRFLSGPAASTRAPSSPAWPSTHPAAGSTSPPSARKTGAVYEVSGPFARAGVTSAPPPARPALGGSSLRLRLEAVAHAEVRMYSQSGDAVSSFCRTFLMKTSTERSP